MEKSGEVEKVEKSREVEKVEEWRSGGVEECDGVRSPECDGVRSVTEFKV